MICVQKRVQTVCRAPSLHDRIARVVLEDSDAFRRKQKLWELLNVLPEVELRAFLATWEGRDNEL